MPARNALLAALLPVVAVAGCGAGQESFIPTENDQDPARRIAGIKVFAETNTTHVPSTEQVPYERIPPTGGPHDLVWAECTGTVYDTPVRNENMVHSLEHGAVWIAYHPEQVSGPQLQALVRRVQGQPYTMLSPYPDLPAPISLQAWGHQLQVDDAQDERIDQFLQALRANPYTSPEAGSPCESTGTFDPVNPPPLGS
ncbi:MAG TPA: DUF3105 domain-containing protein [Pseudonocardiaceae bacterium]|nr:DUF3105 domain-containing protein [Pseudonocardiaceae bacterium]